ncbi:RidA family protein [Mesorhizobium sp. WSM4887]|uniref:RidA family protein n=1 Tax=Mesorhizobium sp. WSM4887 TaxID=3038543 RepID=UPI002415CE5A|nr:RidA family protein [Mesorhizobium sp. WSM4887]MDG4889806.1 RidA family protein [Mesorhizobium sp. WSM4887]
MTGVRGPKPQGDYVPATRQGNLIFTSGMTPRKDGVLTKTGLVLRDAPLDIYSEAVELACANALAAARTMLRDGEKIKTIVALTVYMAAEPGFTAHAKLADFASAFLRTELGDSGIGSRAAIGVATLPGNAPVEIQLVAAT